MIYVTCSVLPEENEDQVRAFLDRRPEFLTRRVDLAGVQDRLTLEGWLRLSPASSGTDGFFAAVLERQS